MAFAWYTTESGKVEVLDIPQTVQAAGAEAAMEWLRAEKAKRLSSPGKGRAERKPCKR